MDVLKIEEMEKLLREAQLEKARLIESRVRRMLPVPASKRGQSSQRLLRLFLHFYRLCGFSDRCSTFTG